MRVTFVRLLLFTIGIAVARFGWQEPSLLETLAIAAIVIYVVEPIMLGTYYNRYHVELPDDDTDGLSGLPKYTPPAPPPGFQERVKEVMSRDSLRTRPSKMRGA